MKERKLISAELERTLNFFSDVLLDYRYNYDKMGEQDKLTQDYLHDIDGDNIAESLNLGFAYMPEEINKDVSNPTDMIADQRINKSEILYDIKGIELNLGLFTPTIYVYSYKNVANTRNSRYNIYTKFMLYSVAKKQGEMANLFRHQIFEELYGKI